MEFCSCVRGRQWRGIIHYYWWTASIKPRLLFSLTGYASGGLSLLISLILDHSYVNFIKLAQTYFRDIHSIKYNHAVFVHFRYSSQNFPPEDTKCLQRWVYCSIRLPRANVGLQLRHVCRHRRVYYTRCGRLEWFMGQIRGKLNAVCLYLVC